MSAPTTTLMITTFNRSDALAAVLQTVVSQTVLPNQVLVADDGSDARTRTSVLDFTNKLPITYCWQPDSGFRAARSRNLALSRVESEYIVLIDGDCLLPPHFIASHLSLARKRTVLAGPRFLFNEARTNDLLSSPNQFTMSTIFKPLKFRRIMLGPLRDLCPQSWTTVRTCNLSLFTEDIRTVAGFDESYTGWGREDSDLMVRLLRGGASIRSGRFAACVGHLHHPEAPREQLLDNDLRFREVLVNSTTAPVRSLLKDHS